MELFGSNTPAIVQYLLAFVIVLGVLAVFAAVLRRITGGRPRLGYASSSARHRQQRLGVIDAVDIDAHRQLLLLRRDNVEHLVLIGGPNDLLVESGIGRLPYRAPIQAPQPAVEDHGAEPARLDQPAPQAAQPAVVAAGAALAGAGAGIAGARVDADPLAASPDPLDPLTRRPPPPRSLATPVPPTFAPPEPAAEKAGLADAGPIGAQEPVSAPPLAGGETSEPTLATILEPAAGEPAARAPAKGPFSAVARQLEEALKRPFAAVRPAPVTGIDLDEATPAAARAPTPESKPVAPAAEPGEDRGAAAAVPPAPAPLFPPPPPLAPAPAPQSSPPPVQVTLPLPGGIEPEARLKEDRLKDERDSGPVEATKPVVEAGSIFGSLFGGGRENADIGKQVADKPAATAPDRPVEAVTEDVGVRGAAARPVQAAPQQVTPPPAAPVPRAPEPRAPEPRTAEPTIIGPDEPLDVADALEVPEALRVPPEGRSGPAASQPAAKGAFDLSSLENIEAEFARLLGRTSSDKDK